MDPHDALVTFSGCFTWERGAVLTGSALAAFWAVRRAPAFLLHRIARMRDVDHLDRAAFTRLVLTAFRRKGYESIHDEGGVTLRKGKADFRLICGLRWTKGGVRFMETVLLTASAKGAQRLVVVTNRPLTKQAALWAKECGVEILDRNRLARLLYRTRVCRNIELASGAHLQIVQEVAVEVRQAA